MELMKTKKLHPLVNQDFKKETCEAVQNLKADLIFCRKYIYNTGPQRTPIMGEQNTVRLLTESLT